MLRNGTYKTQDGRTVTVKHTITGYLITDVATGEVTVIER